MNILSILETTQRGERAQKNCDSLHCEGLRDLVVERLGVVVGSSRKCAPRKEAGMSVWPKMGGRLGFAIWRVHAARCRRLGLLAAAGLPATLLLGLMGCGSHDGSTGSTDVAPSVGEVREKILSGCQSAAFNGTTYLFCTGLLNWSAARDSCRAQGEYQLARVDNVNEAAFIA